MKILIVEDQSELLEAIAATLSKQGYVCETAGNFNTASEKISVYDYDLLVVDINLPGGGSGLDLIREIKKQQPETGIIVISARNSTDNKIEGLELGADDYLTKPFDLAELTARVKSLLRRKKFAGSNLVIHENVALDPLNREVKVGDQPVDLTRSEFDILNFFFANPGRVIPKDSLAEHIWGDHMDMADSYDFIYSHMKNLRKKLSAAGAGELIKAVYGVGYKLSPDQ
jgi:DNA-binding response OmpR family regulator